MKTIEKGGIYTLTVLSKLRDLVQSTTSLNHIIQSLSCPLGKSHRGVQSDTGGNRTELCNLIRHPIITELRVIPSPPLAFQPERPAELD
jgi:hypothetical protein